MIRIVLALGLLALLAATSATTPAISAATCSGGLPGGLRENLEAFVDWADVIVIAEITATEEIPPTPLVSDESQPALTATFEPLVVLSQNQELTEFTIGPLRGTGPDCSGGPRLQAGERVLLFLTPEAQYNVAYWRVGVFGDVIEFDGGDAYYRIATDDPTWDHQLPAGSSAEVIKTLLDVVQPDGAASDAALAFLNSLPPPSASAPTSSPISPPNAGDGGLR